MEVGLYQHDLQAAYLREGMYIQYNNYLQT